MVDSEQKTEENRNDSAAIEESQIVKVPSKFARSAFKQEKVKCIGKPVYSDLVVFLVFLGAGFICAACCGFMLSEYIYFPDTTIDYTYCKNADGKTCAEIIKEEKFVRDGDLMPECTCEMTFSVDTKIHAPVGVYIHISNFFQNYRQYASSMDKKQLNGQIYKSNKPIQPNEHCRSFDKARSLKDHDKVVFPCGAIAYSWFSDQFQLFRLDDLVETEILLKKQGVISRNAKLTKMPEELKTNYSDRPPWFDKYFKKPASWRQKTFEDWWNDGGMEGEAFVNWMSTSSHTDTRKLFRLLDTSQKECDGGLCKGNYKMKINYNFQVTTFNGKKNLEFNTVRPHGSKNKFLMIMFGTLTVVSLLLAPIMFYTLQNRKQIMHEQESHILSTTGSTFQVDLEECGSSKEASKTASPI